ncbi:MAG: succinate dehydrogenase, cytochrome b556 subunit [Sphingomonadaceae bacterium]
MSRNAARPLSPHLTIWRWGPHMLVSILHRATGVAMATGGMLLLLWWLVSLASGEQSYATFLDCVTADEGGLNPLPMIILIGLTWVLFQHLCSGLRHFVLDTGAGYELKTNKFWATMTMVASIAATAAIWLPTLVRF